MTDNNNSDDNNKRIQHSLWIVGLTSIFNYLISQPIFNQPRPPSLLYFLFFNLWEAILGGWVLSSIFFLLYVSGTLLFKKAFQVESKEVESKDKQKVELTSRDKLLDFCYMLGVVFFATSIVAFIFACICLLCIVLVEPIISLPTKILDVMLQQINLYRLYVLVSVPPFVLLLNMFLETFLSKYKKYAVCVFSIIAFYVYLITLVLVQGFEWLGETKWFVLFVFFLSGVCMLDIYLVEYIPKPSKKVCTLQYFLWIVFIAILILSSLFLCNAAGYIIVRYVGIANPQIHLEKDLYVLNVDNYTTIRVTVRSLSTPINDSNISITLQSNNTNQSTPLNKTNIGNGEYLIVYHINEPGVFNISVVSGRLGLNANKGFVVTSIATSTTTTSTTTPIISPSRTTSIMPVNTTS